MRALYCGNFEHDARQSEIERLFTKYGKVDRVDMKLGFAFVYMDDERDAEDAIRCLDNTEFGRQRRRICVEWTKKRGREINRREGPRRFGANLKPTKALFVINFDPVNTRVRDLERHFEPYGKILDVRIRRNFAFIHYETQEEATKALELTNMSKIMDRVISVEYASRDDDDDRRGRRTSPGRRGGYGRHEERNGQDHGGSASLVYARHAERGRQEYGRASSPLYSGHAERGSHNFRRATSPVYDRYRSRSPVRQSRS